MLVDLAAHNGTYVCPLRVSIMLEMAKNRYGLPETELDLIRDRDRACVYCHKTMIHPRSDGPRTDWATIEHLNHLPPWDNPETDAICCWSCNSSRGNRLTVLKRRHFSTGLKTWMVVAVSGRWRPPVDSVICSPNSWLLEANVLLTCPQCSPLVSGCWGRAGRIRTIRTTPGRWRSPRYVNPAWQ